MPTRLKRFAHSVRRFINAPVLAAIEPEARMADSAAQLLLKLHYQELVSERRQLPPISDVGFGINSQTDEDGILLFLFAVCGVLNRRCVELCAGDGRECNSANLVLRHGWDALLVDGEEGNVAAGRAFYGKHPQTYAYPPAFVHAWVTREGINDLLARHGFAGEIDLLTVDLDGVDYWIWEAISVTRPRVVVVEYQDTLGPDRSWSVPYDAKFSAREYPMTDGMPNFAGASLLAFVKLAARKGYRLVGTNRLRYNAFFVRNDVAHDLVPAIDYRTCFGHRKVQDGMRDRFPIVKDLPWVEV